MFSGIVEAKTKLLEYAAHNSNLPAFARIKLEKPSNFNDISLGDSIAVNGVCLTVEEQSDQSIQFALGAETLRVTGWDESVLRSRPINLERSLKWNDRIHGHLVSGHVDAMGEILASDSAGENCLLKIRISEELLPFVWKKGSLCVNGVSLTVNEICDDEVEVGLIPETLKRTNLGALKVGDHVTIEVDQVARGLSRWLEMERQKRELNP